MQQDDTLKKRRKDRKMRARTLAWVREKSCDGDANAARLDVQEGPPTSDQLNSILEYLGPSQAGSVISDATGLSDALRKFKANENSFQRPVTVDWNNGRAGMSLGRKWMPGEETNLEVVVGENESEIMKLVKALPKETKDT